MERNDLMGSVLSEIERLDRAVEKLDADISAAPPGCLETNRRDERTYYRQKVTYNGANGDKRNGGGTERRYLAPNDPEQLSILKGLIKRGYYKKLKAAVLHEKKTIQSFAKVYDPAAKFKVYDALSEDKKKYCDKFFYTEEEIKDLEEERNRKKLFKKYEKWALQPEYANSYHVGDRVIETRDGHRVRSKSERMIADELAAHSERLAYKYEAALNVSDKNSVHENSWQNQAKTSWQNQAETSWQNQTEMSWQNQAKTSWQNQAEMSWQNYNKICYPDFIIFDKKNGREYVWEHFGMMDTPAYANREFIAKLEAYENVGMRLGENLLTTFESSEHPLQLSQVKSVLGQILAKD